MVMSVQQVTNAALQLSDSDRRRVASVIWASLAPVNETAADLVALTRDRELTDGTVRPLTHAQVFSTARAALK